MKSKKKKNKLADTTADKPSRGPASPSPSQNSTTAQPSSRSTARSTTQASTKFRWRSILVTALIGSLAIIIALVLLLPGYDENSDPVILTARLVQARQLLESKNYPAAEQMAAAIPAASPLFEQSRLVAGEAATRSGRLTEALAYYDQIGSGTSSDAVLATYAAAEIYRSQCRLALAIAAYNRVLEFEPDNVAAHERLAFLLGVTRQNWQAAKHHLALVRLRAWTLDSLAILSDIERSVEQPAFIEQCVRLTPDEALTLLAQAAEYLYAGKIDQARATAAKAVAKQSDLLTAQALLGELMQTEEPAALAQWNAGLPESALKHSDIWYVRGIQARSSQNLKLAAGCFAKAVRLVPEHRRATYQLGQVLAQIGFAHSARFVERAKLQAELGLLLDQILNSRGQNESAIQRAAEVSEQLGRSWEAWAWATTGSRLFPTAAWPLPIIRRLSPQLVDDLPRTILSANLATDVDLNPLVMAAESHSWSGDASSRRPMIGLADSQRSAQAESLPRAVQMQPATQPPANFRLEDSLGIDFVYFNGPDPQTPGARMFEQSGGGVGAIDFDNDGWSDVYFTQGSPWKTGETVPTPAPEYHDTLYRNLHGQRFQEVTDSARISELNFSQGVAVGDYDADGFDDVLVGNIGPCTLWHNNGDGTFSDATAQLGPQPDAWTTSVLFADLNGDLIIDIFKVTYLKGADVYTAICNGKGCSPKGFEGEVDQLLLGRGDGTFELQADTCPTVDSKGMGVIALKLGDSNALSLFISNDQVANYLLVSEPMDAGKIRFNDEALVRGVAYNADGLPMAGMGIAADDIDGNGLVDLLVTNFANEFNTLYMQDSPGLFVDASQMSGMQAASFQYVGWGTQLIDIDFDGDSDLVVGNGHVDDYRMDGGLYEMPPQLFRNTGRGRFVLVPAAECGNYFAGMYSARAMASLDWNQDGRLDFVVSNIGQKASLVTNACQTVGHYLNIRLVGTRSPREPLGALVTVRTKSGSASKQLVGGSGYQAANEKLLQFGLGQASEVEQVTIKWPDGSTQQFGPLPADATVRIVEGSTVVDSEPTASTQATATSPVTAPAL